MTKAAFTVVAGALALVPLVSPGAAIAAPTGASSAADTISTLQSEGYNVQVNGIAGVPLARCTVTGVHGLSDSNVDTLGHLVDPTQFTTVYVDISCPSDS